MAAFSDYMELRILQATLIGTETFVLPHTIRIGTYVDTDTYTVTINGTAYNEVATGGDTELVTLNALASTITGGSAPVVATVFTDLDGESALKVAQDGTFVNFVTAVSTSGASTMTDVQEVYVALYTTDPTDADSGTEVSGVNYTREIGTFGTPVAGLSALSVDCQFNTAGAGGWGTVTHMGIHDDIAAGNLIYHGALAVSKAISESDSFVFRINNLTITLA